MFPEQTGKSVLHTQGREKYLRGYQSLTTTVSLLIFRSLCPFQGLRSRRFMLVVEGCPLSITALQLCLCRTQL